MGSTLRDWQTAGYDTNREQATGFHAYYVHSEERVSPSSPHGVLAKWRLSISSHASPKWVQSRPCDSAPLTSGLFLVGSC